MRREKTPQEGGASFSLSNRIIRLVWMAVWLLCASWTPASFQPWRRLLLVAFGAKMGKAADVRGTARIWLPSNLTMGNRTLIGPHVNCYNQGAITISDNAIVSQGVHLCAGTHDIDNSDFPLITKPIFIGENAWVAAEAFVGPGTRIERGAVLGARAVAFGKLNEWTVYAGNPAKPIRKRKGFDPS